MHTAGSDDRFEECSVAWDVDVLLNSIIGSVVEKVESEEHAQGENQLAELHSMVSLLCKQVSQHGLILKELQQHALRKVINPFTNIMKKFYDALNDHSDEKKSIELNHLWVIWCPLNLIISIRSLCGSNKIG